MLLRRALVCATVYGALTLASPSASRAVPVRGSIPWDFIACSFSDTGFEPYPISNLQARLLSNSPGSLADWISSTSYGAANLGGVTLRGYYTINETGAQAQTDENNGRGAVYGQCKQAAANGNGNAAFSQSGGRGLSVITWPSVDTYGGIGESFDGANQPVGEFAHEFGHGLGLNHSWSNDSKTTVNANGDYDNQWDTMSYANVFSASAIPDNQYGGGPGLDAYHRDFLGWLPMSRTFSFGSDGVTKKNVTLAALNDSSATGYLLVRVPVDRSNPLHYFTVEYLTATGYYSGIPGPVVQINEVNQIGNVLVREGVAGAQTGGYYTTILERTPGSHPAAGDGGLDNYYKGPGFKISVVRTNGNQATVSIADTAVTRAQAASVYGPNTCVEGYVWRSADDLDYVCVAPSERAQALSDDAAAPSRHLPGSKTCKQGYVWRQAFPNDFACVVPAQRNQAAQDNANTASRYVIPLDSNT